MALSPPIISPPELGRPTPDPDDLERRGRRWLIWSFIFCPCHLPLTMGILAAVFGGTAFGSLISRNTLGVGLIVGTVYAIGVAVGLRYVRAATKGRNCRDGACTIEPPGQDF